MATIWVDFCRRCRNKNLLYPAKTKDGEIVGLCLVCCVAVKEAQRVRDAKKKA